MLQIQSKIPPSGYAVPGLVSPRRTRPLQFAALTPIALIDYHNFLQHEQQKSTSTINLRVSAFRAWSAWLIDEGYLPLDPAARVKLISGHIGSKQCIRPQDFQNWA
jgi:hypothetical protein